MAILELRGLKVLPPPDLDDGESLWIGQGRRNHCSVVGGERGFRRSSCDHGQQRQAALPMVAGSSGKILNSVSREAQDGHQAIRRRSDSTKIK